MTISEPEIYIHFSQLRLPLGIVAIRYTYNRAFDF